ncbi:hypothetical protein GCK72_025265 [Caenorhabditis remanei]|uniref:Uncharacterized protein n=1 Tax=Caenorhabditis remanei TaxID=31234 RepID=A0A6A5G1I7_CAERE|nr:hypothetical protein GCK72_025265 [Caenorhabditis remanei]KAF1748798.1 hypothetical protein GCK72_025265 [Caenorhabditis remanei]
MEAIEEPDAPIASQYVDDSPYYHVSRFREFDERPTVAEADSTTPEEKEYERPGEVHVGPVGANVAPDARQPNVPVPRGEQPAPPPNLAQPNPAQPNAAQPYAVVIGQLVQPVENAALIAFFNRVANQERVNVQEPIDVSDDQSSGHGTPTEDDWRALGFSDVSSDYEDS